MRHAQVNHAYDACLLRTTQFRQDLAREAVVLKTDDQVLKWIQNFRFSPFFLCIQLQVR